MNSSWCSCVKNPKECQLAPWIRREGWSLSMMAILLWLAAGEILFNLCLEEKPNSWSGIHSWSASFLPQALWAKSFPFLPTSRGKPFYVHYFKQYSNPIKWATSFYINRSILHISDLSLKEEWLGNINICNVKYSIVTYFKGYLCYIVLKTCFYTYI